jgi:predicted transcriptional regulator
MTKQALKQIRNKMIKELWEERKGELTIEDIAYIFGLEIAQIYRIVKKVE